MDCYFSHIVLRVTILLIIIGDSMDNLFDGLIASKTRIKLLTRFFFNPKTFSYLRELAKEFNLSTNSVREELNQLTKTRLLNCTKERPTGPLYG